MESGKGGVWPGNVWQGNGKVLCSKVAPGSVLVRYCDVMFRSGHGKGGVMSCKGKVRCCVVMVVHGTVQNSEGKAQ